MPAMRRYGYADSLAAGSIAAGGTLGILIPPSIIFIVYGTLAEVSIGKLFLAADDSALCTAQDFVVDGGWT